MSAKSDLKDRARDELFSHINRCGVLGAAEEDQREWMDETLDYLADRYPDLAEEDLEELHALGMRFCQPAIPYRAGGAGAAAGEEEAGGSSERVRPESVRSAGDSDDSDASRVEPAESPG